MKLLERAFLRAVRHRAALAALIIIVTALSAWQTTTLKVNNGLDVWFLEDDPAMLRYREYQDTFGNDEVLVVAVERFQGFDDPVGRKLLQEYSAAISGVDGVAWARSAADETAAEARRHLLSRDGSVALITARMAQEPDLDRRRGTIFDNIDAVLATHGVTARKAGVGVIYEALNKAATTDSAALLVASALLITLSLWALGGSLSVVLPATVSVAAAATWTLGLYTVTGHELNMVTMILPSLVLVVGIATCVHVFVHCMESVGRRDPLGDVPSRLLFIVRPCAISGLTSAAGFAALEISRIPVVRELGMFAAVGVLLAVVLSVLMCALFLPRGTRRNRPWPMDRLLDRTASALVEQGLRAPALTATAAAAVFLVACAGIARLEIDTHTLEYFYPDHPVRVDSDFIESRVGPYTGLDFVIHAEGAGTGREELIRELRSWQEEAVKSGAAAWSVPGTGSVPDAADAIQDGAPAAVFYAVEQFPGRIDGAQPQFLRVTFGVPMQSARGFQRAIDELLRLAAFPPDVQVYASGYLPLYTRIVSYLVESQLASMALAFFLVFAVIGALLRSLEMTFLAFLVNTPSLAAVLGFMGFAGIRIDVATVTIAAIILGLIVDDTVHVLYRLVHSGTPEHVVAVRRVMRTAGRALTVTTALLIVGFSVLMLAQVKSIVWFGLLVPVAAGVAFVADMTLLPALVVLLRPQLQSVAPAAGTTVPKRAAAGLCG
ncbi:MAG: MMPL family transporter [Gammaproteobacteria bacterium]|nr:MMPL family transporter [Gammaproteobacteria bacterium]